MVSLNEVREYWNEHIIGIDITSKEIGTREFFDDIEGYHLKKYKNESELVSYEKFNRKKILEVGCGWGFDLIQFAKGGADVVGIDLSEKSIKLAKEYFTDRNVRAELKVGNAEELDFPDDFFDGVISLGVLHHTPDTQKAIGEVYRVLKPGGEALIMLYNKFSWYNFFSRISKTNYENEKKDAPIVKLYSKKQVLEMLKDFRDIKIEISGLPAKTIKRHGFFVSLYNNIFVPVCNILPKKFIRRFGFHINISAFKLLAFAHILQF